MAWPPVGPRAPSIKAGDAVLENDRELPDVGEHLLRERLPAFSMEEIVHLPQVDPV